VRNILRMVRSQELTCDGLFKGSPDEHNVTSCVGWFNVERDDATSEMKENSTIFELNAWW
jgi:hypothetical protein